MNQSEIIEMMHKSDPVAWMHPANASCVTTDPTAYARGIPLYTAPPAQTHLDPLSDQVIEDIWMVAREANDFPTLFARAIETAVRKQFGVTE